MAVSHIQEDEPDIDEDTEDSFTFGKTFDRSIEWDNEKMERKQKNQKTH